jgi:hypothetical protein
MKFNVRVTTENGSAKIRNTYKNVTAVQIEDLKRSHRAKAGIGSVVDFRVTTAK